MRSQLDAVGIALLLVEMFNGSAVSLPTELCDRSLVVNSAILGGDRQAAREGAVADPYPRFRRDPD